MSKVVNLAKCFERFEDTFSPKVVAELNGQLVMVVRAEGDKVPWHRHENEDELFLVVEGELEIHLRDSVVTLNPGELYVVPKGIEHRISPRGPVKLLLFEPSTIAHTGKVRSEITRETFERLQP
jgi:mannose-6-phosphate isomerase-like protein (cupin superfamily)